MNEVDWFYTFLRTLSAGCGFYVGIYFVQLFKVLPRPQSFRVPFLILGLGNMGSGMVYVLAVLHVDGFGAISNTGRIIQILMFVFQLMPYVIARSMSRFE